MAKRCVFPVTWPITWPVTWIASVAAALSPVAQGSARAQVTATPQGAGTAISESGEQFDITGGTQTGGNLFHEFEQFDLSAEQTANFTSDSGVFNIVGQISEAAPSYIDGTVQVSGSDANLYLVNPSGMLFGPNAQLSLSGSFTATSADQVEFNGNVLNALETAHDYSELTGDPSALTFTAETAGAVVNEGKLAVNAGESISLVGGTVVNTGSVTAPEGEVGLVAVGGNRSVKLATPGSLLSMEVASSELALAPSGTFEPVDLPEILTGKPVQNADSLIVNADGSVTLTHTEAAGEADTVVSAGAVVASGEISVASQAGNGEAGGAVALVGESVSVSAAQIDASGDRGGSIRVGGDIKGEGTLLTAENTVVDNRSTLLAEGTDGDGGDIVVWADETATIAGQISAQGTTEGGFVETSAKHLDISNVEVDISGEEAGGNWLIDPVDFEVVVSGAGANQINASTIESTIDSGGNVSISTSGVGVEQGDIQLQASINQTNAASSGSLSFEGRRFEDNGHEINMASSGQLTFDINAVNPETTAAEDSIQHAIAAIGNVNGRRLIRLGEATYDFDRRVVIDTDVEIEGVDPLTTIFSTSQPVKTFRVDAGVSAAIRGVTVTAAGLLPGEFGGGIINRGTLTVDNSIFTHNSSAVNGGAIDSFDSGPLTVINSVFRDNTTSVTGNGGAIHLGNVSGTSQISNTIFENNYSFNRGGAIDAVNADLVIDNNSQISFNEADIGGGLLLANGSTATVSDTAFRENIAEEGGGILVINSALNVIDSSLVRNQATREDGGGISVVSSSAVVDNTTFERNSAAEDGGGIAVELGADLQISNSTITRNTAEDDGGGLYVSEASTIVVETSEVANNDAIDGGGGVYVSVNSQATLTDVWVTQNTARVGGGLRSRNSDVVIQSTPVPSGTNVAGRFTFNSAIARPQPVDSGDPANAYGGGIAQSGGSLRLTNTRVARNESEGAGGGLAIEGSATTHLQDSTEVSRNLAATHGGAITLADNSALTVADVFIGNNTAAEGGGLFSDTAAAVSITSTLFKGNGANTNGGALSLGSDSTTTLRNFSLIENTAQGDGGAVYMRSDSSDVVMDATSILRNRAEGVGGAIANLSDTAAFIITNALVDNNTAGQEGGAIYTEANSLSSIESAGINRNRSGVDAAGNIVASEDGGGIYITNNAGLFVNRVSLIDNAATNQGGAIYYDGARPLTITNAQIEGNTAQSDGGAIAHNSNIGILEINNSDFINNRSTASGGGIAATGTTITSINNTNFERNSAARNGGGLYSDNTGAQPMNGDRLTLTNSRLIENASGASGGGLYHRLFGNATLQNNLFQTNQAAIDGGGIHISASTATIENNRVVDNEAGYGGGLEISSISDVKLSNSTLDNNRATIHGGGIQTDVDSQLHVINSSLSGNQAANGGGGLFIIGTSSLVNTSLSGNTTARAGGAIHADSGSQLSVRSSTITANQAETQGSGIAETNSLTQIQNTIIADNVGTSADVSGRFIDEGNNLVGQANGSAGFTNSLLVGSTENPLSARLAGLANNGGPTKTHRPLANSFAIDTGRTDNLPTTDQRGQQRLVGSAVDIGAVELTEAERPAITIGDLLETGLPIDPTVSTTAFAGLDSLLALRTEHSLNESTSSIRRLERTFSQSFEDYWDLSAGPETTFSDVQAILRRAQEEYKVNSAVIYAVFAPEKPVEEDSTSILRVDPTPADDDLLNLSVVLPEGELVSYQLPVTRKEALRQVRYFRTAAADEYDARSYRPSAQQMYQWLLAFIVEDLAAQNIQNLMYALDSGLRTAPITAMHDYAGFSLERYGISVVPSMGLMQADFPASVRRATVAMGVSEFTSEAPLPAVPIELQVVDQFVPVSQTVLNEATTLDAVKSVQTLEQPGILHLATHASFDRRSPEDSYIHLWDDDLSMREFSQLDWQGSDLELLILSACSTALGSRNSELGFAGLAAASGVDATVGSLWEVSDVGTLALMSEFYAQLEETDLRFEALRRAQLALLRGETRIEGGNLITSHGEVALPTEWNLPNSATLDHPFFWSAFTMVGNPW